MTRFLNLFVIVTLLAACGRYFRPDRSLKRRVQRSELVGVWSMRPGSMEPLVRDGYLADSSHRHVLVFREDGSMTFDSVYPDIEEIRHITGEGCWVLNDNDDGSTTLEFTLRIDGSEHRDGFSFDEDEGSLILWQTYGDPDMWEFVEYKREE